MLQCVVLCAAMAFMMSPHTAEPFTCPRRNGLCSWSERGGWTPRWKPDEVWVSQYDVTKSGLIVVREMGHNYSGRLVVLTPEYEVLAIRKAEGFATEALWTETPTGGVLLCQMTRGSFLCEEEVTAKDGPKDYALRFPKWCLYPRFLGATGMACVEYTGDFDLLVATGAGGEFSKVADVPTLMLMSNMLPLGPGLLIEMEEALLWWRPSEGVTKIESAPVLWMREREFGILVATSTHRDPRGPGVFSLDRIRPDGSSEKLWSSDELFPSYVVQVNPTTLFLHAACGRHRRVLIEISRKEGRTSAREVWRGRS